MRRAAGLTILTFIFTFATGCNDPLPSRALVDDLRVLGVRAEPPEAAPGQTIVFDALVGDVEVPARPFRQGWALCTPGSEGVATCGDPARVLVLGSSAQASWTVPDDFLAELDPEDAEQGRDVYVVLGIELSGLDHDPESGEHDVAFKRVRISSNPAPNTNPRIDALLVEGAGSAEALELVPGSDARLLVLAGAGSAQQYAGPGGGTDEEEMRYTWLVTRGSVGEPVSWGDDEGIGESSWHVPGGGAPELMVWVVLRDGRGGTAWAGQRARLAQ